MKTDTNGFFVGHATSIIEEFGKLSGYLHRNVEKFVDSNTKALFEISTEIKDGLQKPFSDSERVNEPA